MWGYSVERESINYYDGKSLLSRPEPDYDKDMNVRKPDGSHVDLIIMFRGGRMQSSEPTMGPENRESPYVNTPYFGMKTA